MELIGETVKGLSKKICHAELGSASVLYIVQRFRNKFGMTLCNELAGQTLDGICTDPA